MLAKADLIYGLDGLDGDRHDFVFLFVHRIVNLLGVVAFNPAEVFAVSPADCALANPQARMTRVKDSYTHCDFYARTELWGRMPDFPAVVAKLGKSWTSMGIR